MIKKILFLIVMASLLLYVAGASAIEVSKSYPLSKTAPMKNHPVLRGDEPTPSVPYAPSRPHLVAVSPGDTVGISQWDFQTNGSTGNRVALDNAGGVHFNWTDCTLPYPANPRTVWYNYVSPTGDMGWPGIGTSLSTGTHRNDGYSQITVSLDNRAAIGYHNATIGDSLFYAFDTFSGLGIFDTFSPVIRFGAKHCIWPYLTIDHSGRVQMIASETTSSGLGVQVVGYSRSTDGGATWSTAVQVDTIIALSTIITSSPVSDKVAIVYTHPYDTTSQWYNDAYYVESTDGLTWDFRNGKHNITGYETDADSISAYADIDAVYDFNDDLHIIWTANAIDTVSGSIYYNGRLLHYDVTSGTIHQITQFDSTWYASGWCGFPVWSFTIAKMSIGADISNNALFAAYTSWNIGDCALSGYANGDIFMNYSTDGGATWTLKGDLTDSHTDSCQAGDCDHDSFPSLAEKADDHLHLFYIDDKDAGSAVRTEGSATDNPLLYYDYPNPVRNLAVPAAPRLIFPYDDSSYASGFFLFDWSDPVGVTTYTIEIDNDVNFTAPILISDGTITNSEYINSDSLEGGTYYWRVKSTGFYGTSGYSSVFSFVVLGGGPPACDYVVGDVNNNRSFNGIDVTYGVSYFKGGNAPPYSCECTPGNTWFVAGDVNGNCSFNGIDITYMVTYFKGGPLPRPCPDCPPGR